MIGLAALINAILKPAGVRLSRIQGRLIVDPYMLAIKRRCMAIYTQTIEPLYPRDSVSSQWLDSVVDEILFWYLTIATDGNDWKESYQLRFDGDRQNQFTEFLTHFDEDSLSVLDVGAGALTAVGKIIEGKNLEVVVTDALAPAYNLIFADFGIAPPSPVIHCDAEKLLQYFGANRFHFVYASNCIDHCYDPILAIKNMVSVVKPNGTVLLGHYENVAEQENYTGLHQWNLSVEDEHFVVWNGQNKYFLDEVISDNVTIEVVRNVDANWLTTIIRKY